MYYINNLGIIFNENMIPIPLDLNHPEYQAYDTFCSDGGQLIRLEYSEEEKQIELIELRKQYSELISNIEGMREAIERKAIDDTPIPESIINERLRLKNEYNEKAEVIMNL